MKRRERITMAAVVGALALSLTRIVLTSPQGEARHRPQSVVRPPPRSASERARQEACRWYGEATLRTRQHMEEMEAWDAPALARLGPEAHRRSTIARTMELPRALDAAERAARLATSREEKYEAALLLSRLDCDASYHDRELVAARKLISLAPASLVSLRALHRAAHCNRLAALERQADKAMTAVSEKDEASGKRSGLDRFRLWTAAALRKEDAP